MLERNLVALFGGFAKELANSRASLTSIGPEADELLTALDDLIAFLSEQAQELTEQCRSIEFPAALADT